MNKAELVQQISERTGLGAGDVAQVVDTMMQTIVRSVTRGEKVVLSGFGTFHRKARARRVARDIRAGTPLAVPGTYVPAFKPGIPFREAVARRRRAAAAPKAPRSRRRSTRARAG